ncbi:MAG: efflux RND transporter periplasmic adaptor subunit [Lachnospiraceae bacterium]|nr:efflux RND transporter periplasmic adaptor subunit [Lachnospiraceae bacterium]
MNKKVHILACLCACMALTACGKQDDAAAAPELLTPVMSAGNTVRAEIGDIDNTEIYTAEIIPYTEELSFEMDGEVDTVYVKEGDRVKKGDRLAVLTAGADNQEQKDIENELDAAKKSNAVENLALTYDIKILKLEKELLQDKVKKTSGKEKKETEKELEIKKADITIAEQNLLNQKEMQEIELAQLRRKKKLINDDSAKYYITSTMDGIVSYVGIKKGRSVVTGESVIAVSDEGLKYIRGSFVNSSTYLRAKRCYIKYNGNEYEVAMRAYDTTDVTDMLESDIKPYSYYDFKEDRVSINIGTYVDLCLEDNSGSNVLLLPVNAVYTDDEISYVYKNENGRRVLTEVKKGIVNSSYVEIVSGLEEGDEVYVKP